MIFFPAPLWALEVGGAPVTSQEWSSRCTTPITLLRILILKILLGLLSLHSLMQALALRHQATVFSSSAWKTTISL